MPIHLTRSPKVKCSTFALTFASNSFHIHVFEYVSQFFFLLWKEKKRFLSWQATRELGNPYKSLWKKVPNFEQQMSIYVWCDTNFNLSAQMHFPTLSIKVFWSLGDTMHQICTNLYQSAFDKIHRSSDFINNFKEFKNWKNPHLIRGDVRKLSWFS